MPDGFSVEISGIEEACAMLRIAPEAIRRAAFARALAAAAVPVVEALQAWTPVAELQAGMFDEPGSLAAHIVTDIALDDDRGGVASIGFGKYGAVANFVEFGHRFIGHEPGLKELDKPLLAHPFMREATAESAEAAIDAFAGSVAATMAEGVPGVPTRAVAA